MNNYVVIHLHSDLSNGTTNIDSVTKFQMYIEKAKEYNMKAIAFTEHGNVFQWVKKKECCEAAGLKYIHGVEAYVTESIDEKKRDNYHCCLYARNYEGVLEINKLISRANNKQDGHFYYVPRITFNELINTTNNIIVSTACLGGILSNGTEELKARFIDFLCKNKHRCFLEIQHHTTIKDQINYNNYLLGLHKKHEIPMIVGTDTHSLNELYADGRVILQKSKRIFFENEEGWDLTFKSYNELVDLYKTQNSLSIEIILKAINNTNKLSDMIEEFKLDKTYKYPKLYEDPEVVFKQKIKEGIIRRGLNKKDNFQVYKDRINYEYNTMKENGSIDYLLLEEDIKSWCRKNGIEYGYSRGSVSGSEIAYILNITEIDSIKHGMNFERFMNKERISLADIDTDYPSSQRDRVKEYLFNKKNLYCADIITFNTIAEKGAIRDVGRALDIPLSDIDIISKNIEENREEYREKYKKLFEYVDLLSGVIVSVGSHPCGTVVSPTPLDDAIGLFYTSTSQYPITQINMKEIDGLNFVKLDLLALDNIEIINEVCRLANIERLTPDNIDNSDEKVWESILESNLGVFQWESDFAHSYYKQLFSEKTIEKIKSKNKNFNYIDLFSIGNGAIRPAGESYRNALSMGEYRDNGHKALNDFLSPTMGYLVYQEQIIEFLNKFCGFTMGVADIVRRGFAKKTGTEQYIPKIKDGFIKTMKEKYGVKKEESEELIVEFINVIEAASRYLFSLNHANPYSYIGFACAWLRYYYPLEFLTVVLNINANNEDKTFKAIEYAKLKNIKILPPKFRYSKSEYMYDKEQNAIYKGISSIKFLNSQVSNELYELKDNKYTNFVELLKDLKNTSINSRQLEILVKLNYFSEFGKSNKLLKTINLINNLLDKKQIKKDKLHELNLTFELIKKYAKKETEKIFKDIDIESLINEAYSMIENKDISLKDKISAEIEFLGSPSTTIPKASKDFYYVIELKIFKNKKSITYYPVLYDIKTGNQKQMKIKDYILFSENPFKEGNIIKVLKQSKESKKKKDGDKWIQSKTEFNEIIDVWEVY